MECSVQRLAATTWPRSSTWRIEVIDQEELIHNATEVGMFLNASLKSIGAFTDVRGRGLMIGFDVPEHLKISKTFTLQIQDFYWRGKTQRHKIAAFFGDHHGRCSHLYATIEKCH